MHPSWDSITDSSSISLWNMKNWCPLWLDIFNFEIETDLPLSWNINTFAMDIWTVFRPKLCVKFNSDNHSFQQSFPLPNNFFSITTVRTLCELSTFWIYTDEIIFCNDSPRTAAIFFVTICILRLVFKIMLILSTNLYYMDKVLIQWCSSSDIRKRSSLYPQETGPSGLSSHPRPVISILPASWISYSLKKCLFIGF